MEVTMSEASVKSIPDHDLITLGAEEIRCLGDRLFSRGISTVSTYSRREQNNLIMASRALKELLRLYERSTGRNLACLMISGGL
jgi:hypothetical protein